MLVSSKIIFHTYIPFSEDWWEKINRKLEKTYTQLGAEPFYLPQRAHKELKLLWFSLRCMQTPDYLLFNAPSEWCAIKVLGRDLFVPQTNTCNYPSLQYLLRPQPYGVLFYHQLRNIYSAASASWPSLDLIFSNIVRSFLSTSYNHIRTFTTTTLGKWKMS